MPKMPTSHTKFPADWDKVSEKLDEFEQKMRDAEAEPSEGKRKVEALWPIIRINHERSRYIYEMYYKKKAISKACYDFCLKNGYADANLIAKWKKSGYERLCCLQCIQPADHNCGTTCICRVPKKHLEEGKIIECVTCGCKGCASCDL